MQTTTIEPLGPFSVGEAAGFRCGSRDCGPGDGIARLAFVTDDLRGHAGVSATAVGGSVELTGTDDAALAQAARILSLDVDATSFAELGRQDPFVGALQAAAPGLRPLLFHSPYEAAAWCVLSNRKGRAAATGILRKLSAEVTEPLVVAGVPTLPFPTPAQLLAVTAARGIEPARLDRLHGVARAALDGVLDVTELRRLPLDEGRKRVRSIPGIGPFSGDLVMLRSTGRTDDLPVDEPRCLAEVGRLLDLGRPATQAELEERAAGWAPWRTWVAVHVRAAGPRIGTAVGTSSAWKGPRSRSGV